ncbi:MAG TPA: (Fe-S)-binding protein, partial [Chloroflexia bacterium]|nr:(Fe-S)-binding protein [Chloroflexia bacterium]
DYADRAARFVARTRDFAELLVGIGFTPPGGAVPARVTYQDACHLKHGQKISAQPRQLLRAIPSLEFIEMRDSDMCCGSAGVYNLTQPAMSQEVLGWKTANITGTRAAIVVASNPGCAIQIKQGLRAAGDPAEVLHLAELLERSYREGATPA